MGESGKLLPTLFRFKCSLGWQSPLWNHQHAAHKGILEFDIPSVPSPFVTVSETSRDDKRERMWELSWASVRNNVTEGKLSQGPCLFHKTTFGILTQKVIWTVQIVLQTFQKPNRLLVGNNNIMLWLLFTPSLVFFSFLWAEWIQSPCSEWNVHSWSLYLNH